MDRILLFFGVVIIILGILISYFVIVSAMNVGRSIKERSSTFPQLQANEITFYAPIGVIIVLIGFVILKEAFKR